MGDQACPSGVLGAVRRASGPVLHQVRGANQPWPLLHHRNPLTYSGNHVPPDPPQRLSKADERNAVSITLKMIKRAQRVPA